LKAEIELDFKPEHISFFNVNNSTMKHFFKPIFTAIVLFGSLTNKSNAQTEYGNGAGTLGAERAFFGTDAGKMNTSNGTMGAFNTYIGHFAGKNAYGQYNTFVGNSAGLFNSTGQSNTFIGFYSGKNNGEYVQNTLVGSRAGMLSTGSQNSYFGDQAGVESTGSNNVFLGFRTGNFNKDGSDNVFVGAEAGFNNKSSDNIFIGRKAGFANTSGFANTFIGNKSGLVNKEGSANTLIGHNAGANFDGYDFSTFVGTATGANAEGQFNCYFGASAGWESKGNNNTFLGSRAGMQSKGDNNLMLGMDVGWYNSGNNNNFIGNESGRWNTTGSLNTFIGSESGFSSESGTGNAFMGNKAGYSNKSGSLNTFLGYSAGYSNTTGEKNTYLGYGSGGKADIVNASAVGASAKVMASNCLVLGNNANVGIGVSAPVYQLQMSTGTAAKAGSSSWMIMSDKRLKKGITDFTDGLDLLKQIKPVWFQYNGKAGIETGDKKFVGIIAQEMQKIAPYTIGTFTHQDSLGNKTEYLDYDANAVTYILINSVKEQQKVIEEKDEELKALNSQVSALTKRLEQLERLVSSNTGKPLTGSAARTEPNANGVVLDQNVPNGFSANSQITYFIPEAVKEATINIYSVNGVKVNSYAVKERGNGKLTISANDFQNGLFLYDLVTDGRSNGVKKMVVQK
jgi:hypothetical protein